MDFASRVKGGDINAYRGKKLPLPRPRSYIFRGKGEGYSNPKIE
jgi:hypothetical protein